MRASGFRSVCGQTVLLPAVPAPSAPSPLFKRTSTGGAASSTGGPPGAGEDPARRLAALHLARLGLATRREVAAGFGTDPATLWRWDKACQSEGLTGLLRKRPGPKGPSKLTAQRALEIRELEEQGLGQRQVADRVQLSRATVHRVLGQLPAPQFQRPRTPSCRVSCRSSRRPSRGRRSESWRGRELWTKRSWCSTRAGGCRCWDFPRPTTYRARAARPTRPPGSFGTSSTGIARR